MSTSYTDLNIIKFSPKSNLNTNPLVPETNKLTAENINEILNFINGNLFPVGSIIFNDNDEFDPNVEYGGTWEKIKGKLIIGFDEDDEDFNSLGKTGGSKTHTQTIDEMPKHTHGGVLDFRKGGNCSVSDSSSAVNGLGGATRDFNTGGGQPMNIMNPYHVANAWHRIA